LDHGPPIYISGVARMTGLVEMVSLELFAQADLQLRIFDFSLPSS
jgi:hypothetical protein